MQHIQFFEVRGKITCPECLNKVKYGTISARLVGKDEEGKFILETVTVMDFHKVKRFGKECSFGGRSMN